MYPYSIYTLVLRHLYSSTLRPKYYLLWVHGPSGYDINITGGLTSQVHNTSRKGVAGCALSSLVQATSGYDKYKGSKVSGAGFIVQNMQAPQGVRALTNWQ